MAASLSPMAVPSIEVSAGPIADGLGLPVTRFRELMDRRQITTLCERGTGADNGTYRFTFYYGKARLRLVTDATGRILQLPAA